MGGIGSVIKQQWDPLSLKTVYHNHNPVSVELAKGAEYVSFERLVTK